MYKNINMGLEQVPFIERCPLFRGSTVYCSHLTSKTIDRNVLYNSFDPFGIYPIQIVLRVNFKVTMKPCETTMN